MTRARTGVVAVVVAFVVLGLPDFAHGVAWPGMRDDLHRGLGDLGWLLSTATAGYLTVALSTGWLQRRCGLRAVIAGSAALAGIGLAVVASAPSWPWLAAAFFVHGAGSGGLDAGLNAHVALEHGASTMGFVHAGYGIGAALGPLIVRTSTVAGGGWRGAYAVLALAHLGVLVLALGPVRRPAARHDARGHGAGHPALSGAVFFVYVAFEVAVGQWAYVALTEDGHVGDTLAAACVAGYWGALTIGRIWLGTHGHRHDPRRLLARAGCGALVGAAFLAARGGWTTVGLPVTGLSLSVVFPVLMQLTPERVGSERTATHVGWQAAAGALGGAAGPAAMAVLVDHQGVGAYGPGALALCVLFLVALSPILRSS